VFVGLEEACSSLLLVLLCSLFHVLLNFLCYNHGTASCLMSFLLFFFPRLWPEVCYLYFALLIDVVYSFF